MARSYRRIQQYEKEILELKGKGLTLREIGERLGFTNKQLHNFITRYNANQRKIVAGIEIKPKGRPRKGGTELWDISPRAINIGSLFLVESVAFN